MKYEKAKELKDAGFPQGELVPNKFHHNKGIRGLTLIPTLSELIEACGDKFLTLSYGIFKDAEHKWYSRGIISEDKVITEFAETPKEAVANLWLELNKK